MLTLFVEKRKENRNTLRNKSIPEEINSKKSVRAYINAYKIKKCLQAKCLWCCKAGQTKSAARLRP